MDYITFGILCFIGLVFLVMVWKILGSLIVAAGIAAGILNDLCDLGILTFGFVEGWIFDVIAFILIALAFRNIYTLISLIDLIPGLGFLPFHSLAMLLAWIRSPRKVEKIYVKK